MFIINKTSLLKTYIYMYLFLFLLLYLDDMAIDIFCDIPDHPVVPSQPRWKDCYQVPETVGIYQIVEEWWKIKNLQAHAYSDDKCKQERIQ